MWSEKHDDVVERFLDDPNTPLLIGYIDAKHGLCLSHSISTHQVDEMTYFIRSSKVTLTQHNINSMLQYGTVRANSIQSLLRLMSSIYTPLFLRNATWPDSIKNDFSSQTHKFMASLTDTAHRMDGHTVLYVPDEGLNIDAEAAVKNKELVQRLEASMIHWTRQIKEVLSNQDAVETDENSGPLEEIQFWRSRCLDLSGLSEQLDRPGVKRIRDILEHAKSSYVSPFIRLSKLIQDGSAQAQSNLKFLSTLKEPCLTLSESLPSEISSQLPRILNIIRMIWINSEYYNSRERLTGLLRKVCECQVHFARCHDGNKIQMPQFHGLRGPDITRSLLEIEATFNKNLQILRNVKKTILDVKASSWHDDYNRFKTGIKDLEVMMQNVITSAFETITTVEEGVELLDFFRHLSSREAIRRTIDKKTVEVYGLFNEELNLVKKEFNTKTPAVSPFEPRYAGSAQWARALKKRIDYPMEILEKAFFLPQIGTGDEIRAQYQQLGQALDEYVRKMFNEWTSTVDRELMKLLEVPLMHRSAEYPAMLDLNFDKTLLKLFSEIHYWERLMFEIPHYATEVYQKREDLRVLRENVLLVIRDYNGIILSLSNEERGLFKERIRYLDKKIQPGLTKLTWATKGISDFFIGECRLHASKIQAIVSDYKNANASISDQCKRISELLLVRVDKKRVYDDLDFDEDQAQHRLIVERKLRQIHHGIVEKMEQVYEVFKGDGTDVQSSWRSYTAKMDRMVEEACRLNVKWSLQELSRVINGDGKSSPNPLFRVKVTLIGDKIEFSPSLKKLALMVKDITEQLIVCMKCIKRLPDLLTPEKSDKEAIYAIISRDDEIRKIQSAILAGLDTNETHVQNYLAKWDNYRDIWEVNKEAFIRRYQNLNPPVSSFDADIARYTEVANNVSKEETVLNIQFVMLDCSPLKAALHHHCSLWQNKFTTLLSEMATTRLKELNEFLSTNSENLRTPPQSLSHLSNSLALLEQLQLDLPKIESKFPPLHEQFAVLEKYEVEVPADVQKMLNDLNGEWVSFQQCLMDSDIMLKKHKEKFKAGLLHSSDEFKRSILNLRDEFNNKGPFLSTVVIETALEILSKFHDQLLALKEQESMIKHGLSIFKIEHPPSKELANLEKDVDQLEQIWTHTKEWEELWSNWKNEIFMELVTESMEYTSQSLLKKVNKLCRELKDKNWEICDTIRGRIDQFKRTLPLILDLKNPAMRDRHWFQLKNEMQRPFDQTSKEFTLEKMIDLGFDQFSDIISEISAAASKELSIELALQDISSTWKAMTLDIARHKDRNYFKLRATDDLFQQLEDNQVTLSSVKASRYVRAFEKEVDKWERTLSHILEVVELILTVQRQWMYLENIFLGEDIRKQLPKESAEFDIVNSNWKSIMDRLHKQNNALEGTHHTGMLETLFDMNVKLEEIQKSLDMFLETKRQVFPRFYFLSNDDLLEILGQSKNPDAVQPHLKKCFDNIYSLKLNKANLSRSEALGMTSADGESIEYIQPVILEGPVESWLCDIESAMRMNLRDYLKRCRNELKKNLNKREKWVREWAGQLVIVASQMQWTADVTKALNSVKDSGEKKALKSLKKKQISMLNKFSEMIRGNLSKIQRSKLVALVTIEVHARDVIEKLIKTGCNDITSFEWLSQLRVYWEKELDDCAVRQTNTLFQYGYEYLGNSGRLVITPLTDRCYITLTTALHLHRGGSPKGPAGTGKTETTKDLGKALGNYVIVVNCSEGLDYKSMGRMYSGLAQTGAWGCFDEFNRINVEVLSVVAQQILSILTALSHGAQRFVFEGREISLVGSCGIFITMNPGYAGRTELPDNLKSMFRPIAMVVPDSAQIAEIILFAEGFSNTKVLAKKVHTLYSLAVQQLSKQDHYDFGLRALVSVLKYAGRKKREFTDMLDEEVLLLAMKDMNIAKLKSSDAPLFNGIISDLFPGIEAPTTEYGQLRTVVEEELKSSNLQPHEKLIMKVLQLYETKNSRHAVMVIGQTESGKTVVWKTLQAAMTRMKKVHNDPNYQVVKEYPINPKSLSLGELYGEFDLSTNEWTDGVLSSVMRQTCSDEKLDEKWLVFDGPVDTLWIESMNSVMDDNKVLTLINGERISLPEQVSLLFEVDSLAAASPATISRCGMVYTDYRDIGWQPYVTSWLQKREDRNSVEQLQRLFDKYVQKVLDYKQAHCTELVPTTELNNIKSLCRLFDALATAENGVQPNDDYYTKMIELWFLFALIWSICASVDEHSRKKMDNYLREIEGQFPSKDTIYEYFVDAKQKTWVLWESKLHTSWKYSPNLPFYKIIVPTVDALRYDFLVQSLLLSQTPTLLVGPVGTGKTSVAQGVISRADPQQYGKLIINMSAQTSSNNVQDIIESRVEKRTKGVYVPVGGKKLLTFMDDFNISSKDTYGSQPPLELIRQWLDYGFWYDRSKQAVKYIKDMYLLAAMGPPGGGRTVISGRLQSRFNLINMTFPQESQIKRIYGTMINQKLQDFEEDIKPLGDIMTQATIDIYNSIVSKMLPTPTKIHYLFNLRDISKVFQGLLRSHRDFHDTKHSIIRLWIHECFRVFSDRLVDEKDREEFQQLISEKLGSLFDLPFHNICPNRQVPIFGDFMKENQIYEDMTDFANLKQCLENQLEDHNMEPGAIAMDLVLFRDAVEHVCRIIRVIRQPRGNMLLLGIGGSGRRSLTRLVSYILNYQVFQVEVTRHYRSADFREDIRKLYRTTGVENKPTVFLFADTQVLQESFLEDINNILSSGEVPNLYKQDEFEEVRQSLLKAAKTDGIPDTTDSLFAYLIERVRSNLRIVLCMSPVGETFRNRIRMFPAFVNCTTIDWFGEWPEEALQEVAEKYLQTVDVGDLEEMKPKIAQTFVTIHSSVVKMSEKMWLEMKRRNYVTPTNYLELVAGYKSLLHEKKKELGNEANKLRNGLEKIDETRTKVETMSIELERTKNKVAQFQKQCEEYLVIIVQQKRETDEHQKTVAARSEKIEEEEQRCRQLAETAQHDLDEALPALEEAVKALEALNKKDITEIRSYGRPPPLVEKVMEAVMILLGAEPTWAEAKRQLGETNFIKTLVNFDKDHMTDRVLKKVTGYCSQSDFQPDIIGRVSLAAKSLCMWVRATELYGRIYRIVEPKKQRLNHARAQLHEKERSLAAAKSKLKEITDQMEKLKREYDEKLAQKDDLRKTAELNELRLDRAGRLVAGLSGEKLRWENSVTELQSNIAYLPGDCLVAAAFLSYVGSFLSGYREELVNGIWLPQIYKLHVPCNPELNFANFMAKPTTVRDWNIQGLPNDSFSTENGIIVARGNRWPLMIDPQGQALKWIKNMEGNKLSIIDLQQTDYIRVLENSIQFGTPVLLHNVQEKLDPSLSPILNKAIIRKGGQYFIRLADKEIDYNPEFKFYITTKLSNPHYSPEISTKTTIVNFAVKEQGLQAQLLGIVVRKERPDLEEQKDKLVMSIAAGKKKLVELEDEILKLLNTAEGSLLDDEQLVNTLQTSKTTSQEVSEQLQISEQTEIKIDTAREGYRPCAQRASILFFVINDMGRIDPMYQFSLDSYIELFNGSIDKSSRSSKLEERIQSLNDYHTYAVYRYTCRALFERHKMLFSFQMCAKILEAAGKLNMEEYNFFLRGGTVIDRENQMENPCKWLSEAAWDHITELDKLTNFHGLVTSFEQYARDWHVWFTSSEPENALLPGEWDNACNELQKMLIVRSLRPDRVAFTVGSFIINNLGSRFVEPPVLDMNSVLDDSSPKTPLIFVLSSGVDPSGALLQLADKHNMNKRYNSLSLGQGQSPIASRMIREGIMEGHWVFLANCHLSLSWMPQLDKIVEQLQVKNPHPDFRLWLSSSPHPEFPISILQSGIKMTTEPPKGLKANMKRLYQSITYEQFNNCRKPEKFKKLLFGLCFFHSILLERKKFLMLGWNVIYGFNDSDFEVSNDLLSLYLDEYDETPWDALKYLIAGVNYGGHVTDDWDRRLLHTYINDIFCDAAAQNPFYKLSTMATYYIPKDGPLQSYLDYINLLPNVDHPEAFGQHPNADIASQIIETRMLFDTLLSLKPQVSVAQGESREDRVQELAADVLKRIPEDLDRESAETILISDPSPINVVLVQEVARYNSLLQTIRTSLQDLAKGIKGLVVMSAALEEIFSCIFDGRVPPLWNKTYASQKPLAAWTRDLVIRVEQFSKWAITAHPPTLFWLSGFTFPTSFLTAVLQTSARQNNVSIDSLSWEFPVSTVDDSNIMQAPKDGVWIRGLYLEGAGWDVKNSCLIEADPMELVCPVPAIHFKPVENKRKSNKGMYACPCYYYPNRSGSGGRPSFVVSVDIKVGSVTADHWIKRGTALLMSLDY
ncbi:uncharacterized protein TRIADDRAFT_23475 [Trichoplax adhaerens]|uniref:Dynein axonemal heavy chain 2 n=1 Tax=Trichoplax adhaerens TaxID=10228 RepID=B3RUD9_TRIAD|nr:hypothetical protein TRIADDRAFT_23475 [Trichoplax adhaerens]EDV25795.1 hypothetical protein TRIADDRAFT_23475 [Trichoplax adhaerens]|eukprot:XP_002111828.1 hypothetical protein TRIADDRAFT_23475 [Trichoplax adhaerens]